MRPIRDGICHEARPFLTHSMTVFVHWEMRHDFRTHSRTNTCAGHLTASLDTISHFQRVVMRITVVGQQNEHSGASFPARWWSGAESLYTCSVTGLLSARNSSRCEQPSTRPAHPPRRIRFANSQLKCLERKFVGSNRAASHPRRSS